MDKTHEELATRLKTENEELRKQNKLLYRALEEIRDVNDAIMSDADDEFKAVDVSYLNGFIDAKFSAVEEIIKSDTRRMTNDRKETQSQA